VVASGAHLSIASSGEDQATLEAGLAGAIPNGPSGGQTTSGASRSSSWALENLTTLGDMDRCVAEIAAVRGRPGCAIWLFNFARLSSARGYPALQGLVNGVTPLLARNGVTGEAAAPTFSELRKQLEAAGLHDLNHAVFRPLPFLQAHWAPGPSTGDARKRLWQRVSLPLQSRMDAAVLRAASGRCLDDCETSSGLAPLLRRLPPSSPAA
jgi:hypothetical protein